MTTQPTLLRSSLLAGVNVLHCSLTPAISLPVRGRFVYGSKPAPDGILFPLASSLSLSTLAPTMLLSGAADIGLVSFTLHGACLPYGAIHLCNCRFTKSWKMLGLCHGFPPLLPCFYSDRRSGLCVTPAAVRRRDHVASRFLTCLRRAGRGGYAVTAFPCSLLQAARALSMVPVCALPRFSSSRLLPPVLRLLLHMRAVCGFGKILFDMPMLLEILSWICRLSKCVCRIKDYTPRGGPYPAVSVLFQYSLAS